MSLRFLVFFIVFASPLHAALFDWPTDNRELADGHPDKFYMGVDRNFEGVSTRAWEGGSYGYVRGPQRVDGEIIFNTLHEGIDIAPLHRDAAGNPLDEVKSCAAGTIVHTSHEAGASNYGRYVVIRHQIDGSPIYTLYAHLSMISVKTGQEVTQGEVIGRMGFTGAGINRERAHLHLEIAILLNEDFEPWYRRHFSGCPNKQSIYHGYNLIGMDPAPILLEASIKPAFSLKDHIRKLEAAYQITIPNSPGLSLVQNYPWLVPDGEPANPRGWTISFTQFGIPVKAVAANQPPMEPRLEWVQETSRPYQRTTRGMIAGAKGSPRLTDAGRRFLELINGTE